MGNFIGKYEEPPYDTLLSRTVADGASTPYDVRRYGVRYAIEAEYGAAGASPFPLLAGYIGVLSLPQNEGRQTMTSMTEECAGAEESTAKKEGIKIAMTAPVAMHGEGGSRVRQTARKMQFILPAEYDDFSEIPKPTNPNVKVTRLPEAVGAVHRYTGTLDRSKSKQKASELAAQLREDGVDIGESDALGRYQYWRFNPPFSLPFLSRNEVWIELDANQTEHLLKTCSFATNAG